MFLKTLPYKIDIISHKKICVNVFICCDLRKLFFFVIMVLIKFLNKNTHSVVTHVNF